MTLHLHLTHEQLCDLILADLSLQPERRILEGSGGPTRMSYMSIFGPA